MTEVLALYAAGAVMCMFLLWRDGRFQVQLPWHSEDAPMCVFATWSLRAAISTYWLPFLIIEASVHKRAKQ